VSTSRAESSNRRSSNFNKFKRSTGGLHLIKGKFAMKMSNNLSSSLVNEWELIFKNRNVRRCSIRVKFSVKGGADQLLRA
jgi:hypothetical protein